MAEYIYDLYCGCAECSGDYPDPEYPETGPDPEDLCPECKAPLIMKWSGVACSSCDYWFCL